MALPRSHSCGQEHSDTGAAAGSVTDFYMAAVCENDGPADSKSEPMARHFRSLRHQVPEERFEYAFAIPCGDTWPLVVHGELQFRVFRDPSRDADCGACRRVLDRVLDEIREHAFHLTRIRPNRWHGRRHVDPQEPVSKQAADAMERAVDDGSRLGKHQLDHRFVTAVRRGGSQH